MNIASVRLRTMNRVCNASHPEDGYTGNEERDGGDDDANEDGHDD